MRKKTKKHKLEEVYYYGLSSEAKNGVLIIFLILLAIIFLLSFFQLAGTLGVYFDKFLSTTFGIGRVFIPLFILGITYTLIRANKYHLLWYNYLGMFLFFLSIEGLLQQTIKTTESFALSFNGKGGGIFGYLISFPLLNYLGQIATIIILIGLFFVGIILTFNAGFSSFSLILPTPKFKNRAEKEYFDDSDEEDTHENFKQRIIAEAKAMLPTKAKKLDTETEIETTNKTPKPFYQEEEKDLPKPETTIKAPNFHVDLPVELLDDKKSKPTSGDIRVGMERIQRTLENFHIKVDMAEVQVGPTVTQYTFKPADGIKLSRITALNNDLALALAAHPLRIEAPIPGKSLVGLEVPNQKPAVVRIREILENDSFKNRKTNTTIVLGKDVSGKCWVADLAGMPHLLVAGSTGSGKSVCLNAIIMSLIYQNNPDTLRLILVDPKRVEFPVYNGIPHLLTPVITDVTKTVYALRWAIGEMDRRFDTLAKMKKRNIASYNDIAEEKMPYLVIILDELADLMVAAAAEVEGSIIRLTQMARAVGIHLVVATQRPSVDVITGLIKANIPCRIAFSVASLMDSRTILDTAGAEKLVGKGDMLYMSQDSSRPRRIQGAYVSDEEIKRVVDYLKDACEEDVHYLEDVTDKPKGATSFDFDSNSGSGADDDLFDEAKNLVIESGKASASYLQRRLRVGYSRAARLIDLLEEAGIVGPADGAKPREILVAKNNPSNITSLDYSENEEEETKDIESIKTSTNNDSNKNYSTQKNSIDTSLNDEEIY